MPLTQHNVTCQLNYPGTSTPIGGTFIIWANTTGHIVKDSTGHVVYAGQTRADNPASGSVTIPLYDTAQAGIVPPGFQWAIEFDPEDERVQPVGPFYFSLTADKTFEEIVEAAVGPYSPTVLEQLDTGLASIDANSSSAFRVQQDARIDAQVGARRVIYVDILGNDSNSGTSPGKAKRTIPAAIAAGAGKSTMVLVAVPPSNETYDVSSTIDIPPRTKIVAWGARDSATGAQGVTVRAVNNVSTGTFGGTVLENGYPAVFSHNINNWWHWSSLEGIAINGNAAAGVNVNGVHIHQMGEESRIRQVEVRNCKGAGYLLTGSHAVGHMENFSAWGCQDYGVRVTNNTAWGTSASGSIRMIGSSGDANTPGWLYANGGTNITEISPKHEDLATGNAWWTIAGSGTGGGRVRLAIFGGIANAYTGRTGTAVFRITGTATPTIVADNVSTPNIVNVLDDQVKSYTLVALASNFPQSFRYGKDGNDTVHMQSRSVYFGPNVELLGDASGPNPTLNLRNSNGSAYDVQVGSVFATERYRVQVNGKTVQRSSIDKTFLCADNSGTTMDALEVGLNYLKPMASTVPLPTASSTLQGQIRRVDGGAGVADRLVYCRKDAAGAYAWVDLF